MLDLIETKARGEEPAPPEPEQREDAPDLMAALGRFVMRAKEYLAIVRVRDDVLTLTTMVFADEVRPIKDVGSARQKSHKPTAKQVDAAVAVIEELSCDWEPEKYKDQYRARL